MLNEKALNSLVHHMDQRSYTFGDTVFDWGKPISRLYIVKEGEVRLRKPLEQFENIATLDKIENKDLVSPLPSALYKDKAKQALSSVEVAIRERNHMIAEEYLFMRGTAKYRVQVSSASCTLASIPFMNIRMTLSTYDMYLNGVREQILQRHVIETNLRSDIEARGYVGRGINPENVEEKRQDELIRVSATVKKIQDHRAWAIEGLTLDRQSQQSFVKPHWSNETVIDRELVANSHMFMQKVADVDRRSKEEAESLKNRLKEKLQDFKKPSQFNGVNSILK